MDGIQTRQKVDGKLVGWTIERDERGRGGRQPRFVRFIATYEGTVAKGSWHIRDKVTGEEVRGLEDWIACSRWIASRATSLSDASEA